MEKKKILYVSQEICPYMNESAMGALGSALPQLMQESGKDIRIFLPRFGTVNERRHQLHEVIRLYLSTGAIMTPIYQTSTYIQAKPGEHKGYEYSRT